MDHQKSLQGAIQNRKRTVSRAVQTGETQDLVQIAAPLPELLQRISSYKRYKRFQLDISNRVEFRHQRQKNGCARTDAAQFRRSTKERNTPVKIHNVKGPLGKPLSPLEQFKRSLHQEQTSMWSGRHVINTTALNLLHLPERISNIEQYLCLNQGGNSTQKDLLTRVAFLEMNLLAVEGRSYEYHHAKVGNKSIPLTKLQ